MTAQTLTPEQVQAALAHSAAETEAGKQREAIDRERRYQHAKKTVAAEEAAKRPVSKLIFDGSEDLSPTRWLVDTIIPAEGAGMAFGETDVGKTFFGVNLGVHISGNKPWQGHTVAHGTTLYIEAEGGRSFALRKQAAKHYAGLHDTLPFITILEPLGFGPDTDLPFVLTRAKTIRDAIAERGLPPIRFVVVDTLAQNMNGDADNNADMGAFLKALRAFLKALSDESVFGLLIHHPGHGNKDRARGAYALPADLDLILKLEGDPEGGPHDLILSCDRMREDERFDPILLALEKYPVIVNGEKRADAQGRPLNTLVVVSRTATASAVDMPPSYDAQILTHLRIHPRQTTAQISTDLKISKSIAVKKVDALCVDGLLRRLEVRGSTGQTKQLYEVAPEQGGAM